MIAEYQLASFKWVDVQQPTKQELSVLNDKYQIEFEIIRDLEEPISDTRVAQFEDQYYLAFHLTDTHSLKNEPTWQELDVIIHQDTIITVTYENLKPIQSLRKELEIATTLAQPSEVTLEQFTMGLIVKVYQNLRLVTAAINSHQKHLERDIFNNNNDRLVRNISETGRVLFSLNQTISEHAHIVKFLPLGLTLTLPNLQSFWQKELEYTADQIKSQYNLYHDLRRTNEELLSTRQNESMRKLTLVAFITSPLTILAGIFGMNTQNVPFIGGPNDFWIIILLMATVILLISSALYYKGWFK